MGRYINPIDITYSSSHEDYEDRSIRGKGSLRDDLSDLKIEALKFDGDLKLKDNDCMQAIERIIELKEYNDKKAFKLAILKLKGYASLWCETLKKS